MNVNNPLAHLSSHFSSFVDRAPKIVGFLLLLPFMFFLLTGNGHSKQTGGKLNNWSNLSVTLYPSMALVKEQGTVTIKKDRQKTIFHPVCAKIIPQSVFFSVEGGLVLEQSFIYKPISPKALLDSYVGKDVFLIKTNKETGKEEIVTARLISVQKGLVLSVNNRIETSAPGRIAFPSIPKGMGNEPLLKIVIEAAEDKKADVELAYLTRGLGWSADYVALMAESGKNLQLNCWVTMKNNSGISFKNASFQLVAGDVNTGTPSMEMTRSLVRKAASQPLNRDVRQEGLFEYHLFSLERPLTLEDGIAKQVSLFSANNVPFKRTFFIAANSYPLSRNLGKRSEKLPVQAILSFENKRASGLGLPMPEGDVRVFKRDSKGRLQFIGQDHIPHIAKDEKVRLNIGRAFDIICKRTQTDYKKLAGNTRFNSVYESSYEVTFKNNRNSPASIRYVEPLSGQWEITDENLRHEKRDANTALWTLDIPSKGKKTLKFTVRVRY